MNTKQCCKCKETKSSLEFYKRGKNLRSECKSCSKQYKHSQNKPCPKCGELCWAKGGVCQSCKNKNAYDKYSKLTIGDKAYDKHKYAKYQYIRYWARSIAEKLGWNKCCKCGYDKHIEVAHIKPISSFSKDAPLIEVNDPSNLIPLCPNCHWEFDNLNH